MKHVNLLLLLCICFSLAGQGGTGLIFDNAAYQAQQRISPSLKFSSMNLPAYSLRKYSPLAGHQGDFGSCVGWATGYAAFTISLAVRHNITDRATITQLAKSALYIFNQIKIGSCEQGSHMDRAVELMETQGVCDLRDFNPSTCNELPSSAHRSLAAANKIGASFRLFDYDDSPDNKIAATIESLEAQKPVLVGMYMLPSFRAIDRSGLWKPQPWEQVGEEGHAMCVVGYNNLSRQFEILNSWGQGFGDDGFIYVSYEDFARLCVYGYNISLAPTPQAESNLQGGFYLNRLKDFDSAGNYVFEKIAGRWNGRYYEMEPGRVRLRDYFKVMATNLQADTYLYIFSIKPNGSSELLFPTSSSSDRGQVRDAPVIVSGSNFVEIPANRKAAFQADIQGVDHLVCLFSRQRLDDIDELIRQVEVHEGDLYDRLRAVLGHRLVTEKDVSYIIDEMRFTSTTRTAAYVVPILLKVNVY